MGDIKLSQLIDTAMEQIVSDWEKFAKSCTPASNTMDLEQRRDHIVEMLKDLVSDLRVGQSDLEQTEKALGHLDAPDFAITSSSLHGAGRAASGYTPQQTVSEFRALRASVLRLWSDMQINAEYRDSIYEITRFNEAIDQLLAESLTKYADETARAKDMFLGVLGHDLRNPLGSIMMSASAIIMREGPDWKNAKTATFILDSVQRMESLINDLLDFTRVRLGDGIPITRSESDLGSDCQKAVDEIIAYHPTRSVIFKVIGDLNGLWDSSRIVQALSNLLGNAVKHGAKDKPVTVTLRGNGNDVTLSVHNKGPQIPERRLQDIFNPFTQLDPNQSRAGVGLGLYIVKAIVTAHSGTVTVESGDTGTTFSMILPRKVDR